MNTHFQQGDTSVLLTEEDKREALQRFLTAHPKRSPRLRAALALPPAGRERLPPARSPSASGEEGLPGQVHDTDHSHRRSAPLLEGGTSERARRDAAQANAERQGAAGGRATEILSGKKLKKAQAREFREATTFEKDEELQRFGTLPALVFPCCACESIMWSCGILLLVMWSSMM